MNTLCIKCKTKVEETELFINNGLCRHCRNVETFPELFRDVSFETSEIDRFNTPIIGYMNNLCLGKKLPPSKGAIIIGNKTGIGKTHLIYCFCRKNAISGHNIYNTSELIKKIRLEMIQDQEATFKKVCSSPWLFLDDFGTEKLTEWGYEQLYLIINSRYLKKLSVFITTNLGLAEMEEKLSPRIMSRLFAMAEVFEMDGKDRRYKCK